MENNKGWSCESPSEFVPLLPPFMQIKRQKFSPVETSFPQVSRETADHDVTQHAYLGLAEKITSPERAATTILPYSSFRKGVVDEKKNTMSSRPEKVASRSDASCIDTKVTREAICEALQGLLCCEAECPVKMPERHNYLESHDSDHREWNGDFQKNETDYQEWRDVKKNETSRTLAHCEGPVLSSDSDHEDEDPNTTDPLLSHELLVPYKCMPRPRLSYAAGKDAEYITTALPRRPRSPVRRILAGSFDSRTRSAGLSELRGIAETRRYLRKSKDRISRSVKQVLDAEVDFDSLICMLVLRALCEQVILTMAGANIETDVHTFVNMAIIWALVDLQILDPNTLDERERAMFTELGLSDIDALPRSRKVAAPELPKALFEVHRLKFYPRVFARLHRCLPWMLVSPTHQRGAMRFYPNVRERIDERLPDPSEQVKSAYVSDLTCFHFREVADKAYVAYKRKSKFLPVPRGIDRRQDDELLVQLVSFV